MTKNCVRVVALGLCALLAGGAALADAKIEEKTKLKFGGAIGKMVSLFAGKSAREGVISVDAVKGDRKLNKSGETGQLVDLAEEKVYQIDFKKKSYTVMTFAEMREQMKKAMEEAKQRAKEMPEQEAPPEEGQVEYEIDADLNETGKTEVIAGYDCREVILTLTMRQKGKTLEEAGGFALKSDMWLGPEIPELKELESFDMRYAKKVALEVMGQEEMMQMASMMATYPGVQKLMQEFEKKKVDMSGAQVRTTMTIDVVASAEQAAAEGEQGEKEERPTSLGGLLGKFGKKMSKKKAEEPEQPGAASRSTLMTSTTEIVKVTSSVAADEVAIPAGFKQR